MASITQSLAGLVSFGATVSNLTGGFLSSYDLKGFYDALAAGGVTLPCALAVPDLDEVQEWDTVSYMGGSPRIQFNLYQWVLVAPVASTKDFPALMPDMITLIDNYYQALKALPFLTAASAPSSHQPSKVSRKISKSAWKEVQYHGVVFRHGLELYL